MRIGIVGHEAAKFTPETERKAREIIQSFLEFKEDPSDEVESVVSGECHLGGVDIYAREEEATSKDEAAAKGHGRAGAQCRSHPLGHGVR